MKKSQLLLIVAVLIATLTTAQTEISYPAFKYDTNWGFTKVHIVSNAAVETSLWKRVTALPSAADLGYTLGANQRALQTKGYSETDYYETNSLAIMDAIDFSLQPSINDFTLTFWNKSQYALVNPAEINILVSTNYNGDALAASWDTLTSQVDTLDQPLSYDSNWVKSTLSLNAYQGEDTVVIAFQYYIANDGIVSDVNPKDRPGVWNIAEVKVTTDTPDLSAYSDVQTWNFSNFNLLAIQNTVGDIASNKWARNAGTLSPNAVVGDYSLKVSGVNSGDNSAIESWAILGSVNTNGYQEALLFSFWNKVQYLGTTGTSNIKVKVSLDYVPDSENPVTAITTANWTDVSQNFNLDPSNHDFVETKGFINTGGNSSVNIAVIYENTTTGVADGTADRASTCFFGDVSLEGIVDTPTGIEENNTTSQLKLYPNPANSFVNFSQDLSNVTVYSLNGQQVLNSTINTRTLDVSSLDKGIYLIRATTVEGETSTKRLMVK